MAPVPGLLVSKSSSAVTVVLIDMRFWKGKSPPTGDVGIGIGAEIVPRMDLCRDLARPRVDPDFPNRLGMVDQWIAGSLRKMAAGE